MSASQNLTVNWKNVPTRTITAGGVEFAYRELGTNNSGTPVVFLVHLAAVLDNWDPRVVDGFAAKRRVITFDNRGIGASSDSPATSIEQMAKDAITFIKAHGFRTGGPLRVFDGGMVGVDVRGYAWPESISSVFLQPVDGRSSFRRSPGARDSPSSFERLMRRPADVGAIDSQPRVVAFNATCALVPTGNKTPSTRPSGRSAHEIIARAAKIRGAAKSLVISPCRTYDAAAPLSSKKTPAYAHSFSRGKPGATMTTAPRSFQTPRMLRMYTG